MKWLENFGRLELTRVVTIAFIGVPRAEILQKKKLSGKAVNQWRERIAYI
jgi:hypothetical protein